jgi:hypothetical protein
MASTIISNTMQHTFGVMTNRLVSGLISADTAMRRLNEAIATASSGFTGTDGTQFEIGNTGADAVTNQNLFGVQADPAAPGTKGKDYSYAINQLDVAWETFWAAARPYIEQLDNGNIGM